MALFSGAAAKNTLQRGIYPRRSLVSSAERGKHSPPCSPVFSAAVSRFTALVDLVLQHRIAS